MTRKVYPNWTFLAATASCFVVPLVLWGLGVNARVAGAALAVIAFVILGFRFADRYKETQTVGRVGVLIILASLMIGAVGQVDLLDSHAPLSAAAWPLVGQRWAAILMGIYYGRLLSLGTTSPWIKPRA